jgi:hypothetical protein
MPGVRPPTIGIKARETTRLQQRFQLQKDLILATPKAIRRGLTRNEDHGPLPALRRYQHQARYDINSNRSPLLKQYLYMKKFSSEITLHLDRAKSKCMMGAAQSTRNADVLLLTGEGDAEKIQLL